MQQETELKIPFSLRLLNHFRSFAHESHTFKAQYLEDLHSILTLFPSEFTPTNRFLGIRRERILIAIHHYFSWISNLQDFVSTLNADAKVVELNVAGFNNTNIFNIHSIYKALDSYRATKSEITNKVTDPEILKEFTVVISVTEKTKYSKGQLTINIEPVPYRFFL
jgi:hypothetical protein